MLSDRATSARGRNSYATAHSSVEGGGGPAWPHPYSTVGVKGQEKGEPGGAGNIIISNLFEARLTQYQDMGSFDQFSLKCTYTVNLLQNGGVPYAQKTATYP
jgi:hypothetical protein